MAAGAVEEDRVAWANRMRLLLSPKGSVNEDGSIKQARLPVLCASVGVQLTAACLRAPPALLQEFFKPKQVVYVAEKKWGETERDKLYEARTAAASFFAASRSIVLFVVMPHASRAALFRICCSSIAEIEAVSACTSAADPELMSIPCAARLARWLPITPRVRIPRRWAS
jgi:hypothetical protein